jgi:competence protein ComEC
MRLTPPAAVVAGVFWLQQQSDLPRASFLVALGTAAVVAIVLARRLRAIASGRPWMAQAIVAAAAFAAGFLWASLIGHARLADELAFAGEGRDVRIVGVVASLPAQLDRGTRFEFAVESIEAPGIHVPSRVALAWYGAQAAVKPAERWTFTVRLKRPHGSLNPGGFDFEAWMIERAVRASGYVREARLDDAPKRLDTMVWNAGAVVDRARHELRERLQRRLQAERYGGVLVALVLGDQRAIREDDWVLFNRTGISHLVSISGLHITMIAGLAALLASGAWRRSHRLLQFGPAQTAGAVAAVATALAYCLLAGWGVPAQRTFFMLATVAIALLLRWNAHASTTLALAAAVVCVLDPWAVIAPGFWLSFGAVAAIFYVVSGRPATDHGWRHRLGEAARIQGAVTLGLVPLTAVLFQQISVVSPFANAVAIPLVSLAVTPLALIGALFVALPEPLASIAVPCLTFAHALFELLAAALSWSVQLPWASVAVAAPPVWSLALACAGVVWLLAPRGWPARWVAWAWFVPMFVWPPARPAAGDLWVTALDVGQGMAILVESPAHAILYDSGPRYSTEADAGARVIAPYLRLRGIDRLDLLVVSHLDSDHSGGTASLARSLPIGRIWTSVSAAHPMFENASGVSRCVDGQTIAFEATTLRVLHPTSDDYTRTGMTTNAMSCVLEVRSGPHRVLLTGDLPARQEAQLVARYPDLKSTVMSAPHHGSRSSSTAAFIDAVRPQWVVFQAGYRNRFAHPDAEVAARYAAAGSRAIRTDHAGATQWRLRGDGSVDIESMRVSRKRYWHNQPAQSVPRAADANDDVPAAQSEPQVEPLAPN